MAHEGVGLRHLAARIVGASQIPSMTDRRREDLIDIIYELLKVHTDERVRDLESVGETTTLPKPALDAMRAGETIRDAYIRVIGDGSDHEGGDSKDLVHQSFHDQITGELRVRISGLEADKDAYRMQVDARDRVVLELRERVARVQGIAKGHVDSIQSRSRSFERMQQRMSVLDHEAASYAETLGDHVEEIRRLTECIEQRQDVIPNKLPEDIQFKMQVGEKISTAFTRVVRENSAEIDELKDQVVRLKDGGEYQASQVSQEKLEGKDLYRALERMKEAYAIAMKDLGSARHAATCLRAERSGEVWIWMGEEGVDEVETLACPVLVAHTYVQHWHTQIDRFRSLLAKRWVDSKAAGRDGLQKWMEMETEEYDEYLKICKSQRVIRLEADGLPPDFVYGDGGEFTCVMCKWNPCKCPSVEDRFAHVVALPCRCRCHTMPGVSHVINCCDKPAYQVSIQPQGPGGSG